MALKQDFFEAELCRQLLQPAVLVVQFVDLLRLKPAILLLQAMEDLFRDSYLPDQVGHSQPHLRLLQNRNNLLSQKRFFFIADLLCSKMENPLKN